ncbi:lysylphosphatidylglycerol synthase transmembrane domain-containing protein [Nitrospira sp. Kam-Ns4a]
MRSRAVAGLLLGSIISAVLLWYAFKGVDLRGLMQEIGQVHLAWVGLSVVAGVMSLVIRGIRWRYLLDNGGAVALRSLVSATFIGIMANNVLPARLGEIVRAWIFARNEARPIPVVFASIVLERILDVIALVAVLGLALLLSPPLAGPGSAVFRQVGLAGLLLSIGFVAGLLLIGRFQGVIHEKAERLAAGDGPAWRRRGLDLFRRFIEGLCALRGRQTWHAIWLSLLVWGVGIVSFHVLAEGFHLGLTIVQSSLVFVVVLLGIAIPSAPGFVGTFHGFCVAGLTLVAGTDPTQAAAYATLLHGSQWLAINTIGAGCLLLDRAVTWSELRGFARARS